MRLLDEYRAVRARTLELAAPLSPEDQGVQSMPDASPTKWHLAHTTWFFETFVLAPHVRGHRPFDPAFEFLFNSYYEAVGPRHDRGRARRALAAVARRGPGLSPPRRPGDGDAAGVGRRAPRVASTITLGLHHEQQHQELLLTDIKHAFGSHPLQPGLPGCRRRHPRVARRQRRRRSRFRCVRRAASSEIGHRATAFAFDNEGPRHRCFLEPSRSPIAPGDLRRVPGAFMRDGGYARPELWLSDGWRIVERTVAGAALLAGAPGRRSWIGSSTRSPAGAPSTPTRSSRT